MASRLRVRAILWSALGLIAVAVIAAIVTFRYGLDAYRGEIERRVEEATGRPFHLRGRLELRLSPLLGIEIGPAELDEPSGRHGPPFAAWHSARLRLELRPLLHHQVVIDRVRIEGLQLNLRRDASGWANWTDWGHSGGAGASPPGGAIELGGLEVRDAAIDLDDEASGRHARLSALQLDVGRSRLEPRIDARDLSGSGPRIEIGALRLDARLTGTLLGSTQGSRGLPLRLRLAGLDVTAAPFEAIVPDWSLTAAGAEADGSLSVRRIEGSWEAHGHLSASTMSLRDTARTLGIEMPKSADAQAFAGLELAGDWSLANGALAVRSLQGRLDDTTLAGSIVRSDSTLDIELRGDRIDLGRYLAGTAAPAGRQLELPVAALRALRVQGSVTFGEARYGEVVLKNARLAIPAPQVRR